MEYACSARVNLQWIREHDQDDDGGSADCRKDGGMVLRDNVAHDVFSEGEIAGQRNQNVDANRSAVGGKHDRCCPPWAVVFDFVQNGEHLRSRVSANGTDSKLFAKSLRFDDKYKQTQ